MILVGLFSVIALLLVCFLYWFFFRPTSLWTGFFFIALFGFTYVVLVVQIEIFNPLLGVIFAIPLILILIIISVFGLSTGVIALFWNERILVKKEGRSLSNMLPLILATCLIVFQVIMIVLSYYVENIWIGLVSSLLTVFFVYGISVFFLYLVTLILYNHFPFLGKVDYIIVLGAGLINGERVTPLLAGRIDVATRLFEKQQKKYDHKPMIILSGGKGSDEKIAEAQAMFNYLEEKGFPLENVCLEDKSTTTQENLQFSEKIIYKNNESPNVNKKNIVVASSDYHTLRAGKIANRLGIFVRAVGSKTKAYYFPTAFIREYIAYLSLTKRRHIMFFGTVLVIFTLVAFGVFIFNN